MTRRLAIAVSAILIFIGSSLSYQAAADDFYRGKQITITVGGDAGGAHDAFTRVLVGHLSQHIPGNPTIIIQNMPGAGGIIASNYIANVAPRDGTVIASLYPANLIQPLLEKSGNLKFDPRTLGWIGSIDGFQLVCFTNSASSVKSVADARARSAIVGSTSPASSSSVMAKVMNDLIDTKFKVVSGYSTGNLILGFERHEIDGICGWGYATIMQDQPAWITGKQANLVAQMGYLHVPELSGVPYVSDFVTSSEKKALLKLIEMRTASGRPYVAPPNVPADRLALLRDAFAATLDDPAYQADAKRANQNPAGTGYQVLEDLISAAYAMPPSVIAEASAISGANP